MPNTNAFKVVFHEKKIFKGFCYKPIKNDVPIINPGTLFEQT